MANLSSDILAAPHTLEYPYTRSTGPVIGRFLTALRERRIAGVRGSDGRVIVPAVEYDPVTSAALEDFVEVGQSGVVTTWAWVYNPRPKHPLDRPFAWALIRLDGADTAMLHGVDAGDPSRMHTGMRVRVRWRDETSGEIQDIAGFVPEEDVAGAPTPNSETNHHDPVRKIRTPIRLDYTMTAGAAQSRFLRQIANGKIFGQRCPECRKVYVPPRGSCPTCGVATQEEVELGNKGTITTFCIVNIPFAGAAIPIPYVCASVLLDGADVTLFHLVREVPVEEVRMGMRVQAVWVPPEERGPTLESITHFRPAGEPDAKYERYKDRK